MLNFVFFYLGARCRFVVLEVFKNQSSALHSMEIILPKFSEVLKLVDEHDCPQTAT